MKKFVYALLLLLAACSWRSPNAEFYVMNSQGLTEISPRQMNIAVAKIKVPDMLDRAQMVTYDVQSDRVQIMEFNRWAEVLPDILQNTVTNDLMAYFPNSFVERTYFDNNRSGYSVNIEINKIQAYLGQKVILSAWWNIKNSAGTILKRRQGKYEVKVHGDSVADLVNAQSQAVHLLSRDIAEQLLKI